MTNARTSRSITVAALGLILAGTAIEACKAKTSPAPAPKLPADALQTAKGQYLGGLDCDPLVPLQCGFPMPSNVYLVHGATGLQVEFGKSTLPTIPGGAFTDPAPYLQNDGFSPGQAAMTYLPGATTLWSGGTDNGAACTNACASGTCDETTSLCANGAACSNGCLSGVCQSGACAGSLATPLSIADSMSPNSPSILMEADTGVRVPHWVDLDESETDGSPQSTRTIMIRPAIRLKDSTRYIVAFRNIMGENGSPVPPSPVFQALRDGTASSNPSVAPRRVLYADIFAKLAKANIPQDNLQIAWDYTTASVANNTSNLISMRDQALAVVGSTGPLYALPPTITATPGTVAPGGTVTVSVNAPGTGVIYGWTDDTGSATAGAAFSSLSVSNPTWTAPTTAGTYHLTVSVVNAIGGPASVTVPVVVEASPPSVVSPSIASSTEPLPLAGAITCTPGGTQCENGDCINGLCLDSVQGIRLHPDQYTAMSIAGTFSVPIYMSTREPPQQESNPPCRMCRDAACSPANFGVTKMMPVQNMAISDAEGHAGFTDYPFLVQIPNSVAQSGKPAPILLNGHGLLGWRTEGEGGWLSELANDKGYIVISIDLTGFDHNAVYSAETAVQGDISAFQTMVDPQHQGITNQVLAIRMLKGGFATDPRFFFKNGVPDPTGTSVIDTTTAFYRGDSQGGIMGGTFMSISVDATRGYLGEPGMPYQLLLNRSLDFGPYFDLLFATYTTLGGRPLQVVLGLMQMMWDRTDPDGYLPYLTINTLPCASCAGGVTPSHVVLLNDAIGDFQVTPFAAQLMARTIGAQNIKPVNREIYGVPDADGPFAGSAITEFNFHLGSDGDGVSLPLVNIANNGPDNCDPHDNVRKESPVFNQTDTFFKQKMAQNYCTGAMLQRVSSDLPGTCDFDETMGPSPEDILAAPATPVECVAVDGGSIPFWCSQSMTPPPSACNPG